MVLSRNPQTHVDGTTQYRGQTYEPPSDRAEWHPAQHLNNERKQLEIQESADRMARLRLSKRLKRRDRDGDGDERDRDED